MGTLIGLIIGAALGYFGRTHITTIIQYFRDR